MMPQQRDTQRPRSVGDLSNLAQGQGHKDKDKRPVKEKALANVKTEFDLAEWYAELEDELLETSNEGYQ